MQSPAAVDSRAGDADAFLEAVKEARGVPHLAKSAREAVETLRSVLDAREPKSVAVAALPLPVKMIAESALKGTNHRFVDQLRPADALQFLAKADAGVTWAQHGLVKQGAVMEVASDDASKLVSSLPPLHIAMLSSRDLLPDLASAMREVGSSLKAAERKPVITLISGPSRTADIEMTLLYGVHGPNEVHVMVLDWL